MPEPELFMSARKGFDVLKDQVYGDYTLASVSCTETVVVRFNQYRYTIKIIAVCEDQPSRQKMEKFIDLFNQHIAGSKIIRTPSGRPYISYFDYSDEAEKVGDLRGYTYPQPSAKHDSDYSHVTLTYYGFAKRISEAAASPEKVAKKTQKLEEEKTKAALKKTIIKTPKAIEQIRTSKVKLGNQYVPIMELDLNKISGERTNVHAAKSERNYSVEDLKAIAKALQLYEYSSLDKADLAELVREKLIQVREGSEHMVPTRGRTPTKSIAPRVKKPISRSSSVGSSRSSSSSPTRRTTSPRHVSPTRRTTSPRRVSPTRRTTVSRSMSPTHRTTTVTRVSPTHRTTTITRVSPTHKPRSLSQGSSRSSGSSHSSRSSGSSHSSSRKKSSVSKSTSSYKTASVPKSISSYKTASVRKSPSVRKSTSSTKTPSRMMEEEEEDEYEYL